MENIEITTKLSRLESVSSIDDDYLEGPTGGVLKSFVIFTGKHLCWSLFLIRLQACRFIEKRFQHWCFPLHVKKIFKNSYLYKHQLLIILSLAIYLFSDVHLQLQRKTDLSVKKILIKIRLCNRVTYFLKIMPKSLRYTW